MATAALLVSSSASASTSSTTVGSIVGSSRSSVEAVVCCRFLDLEVGHVGEVWAEARWVGAAATVSAEKGVGRDDNTPTGAESIFGKEVKPFVELGVVESRALNIYVEIGVDGVGAVAFPVFEIDRNYFDR